MAISVSLPNVTVMLSASVSLWLNSTGMPAIAVSLIDDVSLHNLTGGSGPTPPGYYSYDFSKPKNSFYITTTAF